MCVLNLGVQVKAVGLEDVHDWFYIVVEETGRVEGALLCFVYWQCSLTH